MSEDAWNAINEAVGKGTGHAVQALRLSMALAEILIQKGLVTRAEIDDHMRSTEHFVKEFEDIARRMAR